MARSKKYDLEADKVKGAKRDLPYGTVKAIQSIRLAEKADLPESTRKVSNMCNQRRVDVLLGKVSYRQAPSVLRAADVLMDEMHGPIPKEINVKAALSLEMLVGRMERELTDGEG
jgi:hypothetical protein